MSSSISEHSRELTPQLAATRDGIEADGQLSVVNNSGIEKASSLPPTPQTKQVTEELASLSLNGINNKSAEEKVGDKEGGVGYDGIATKEGSIEKNGDGASDTNNEKAMEDDDTAPTDKLKQRGGSGGNEERKIFVGGIAFDATNDDLSSHFAQFGEVTGVQVKIDRTTGRSRGFAFVEFTTAEGCKAALDQREQQIKNKACEVKPAKSREKNKKIFVGGLPSDFPEEDLRRHFEQFGPVENIEWPFDKLSHTRRNFAFIVFEDEASADKAAAKPKQQFGTREADVKKAVPQAMRIPSTHLQPHHLLPHNRFAPAVFSPAGGVGGLGGRFGPPNGGFYGGGGGWGGYAAGGGRAGYGPNGGGNFAPSAAFHSTAQWFNNALGLGHAPTGSGGWAGGPVPHHHHHHMGPTPYGGGGGSHPHTAVAGTHPSTNSTLAGAGAGSWGASMADFTGWYGNAAAAAAAAAASINHFGYGAQGVGGSPSGSASTTGAYGAAGMFGSNGYDMFPSPLATQVTNSGGGNASNGAAGGVSMLMGRHTSSGGAHHHHSSTSSSHHVSSVSDSQNGSSGGVNNSGSAGLGGQSGVHQQRYSQIPQQQQQHHQTGAHQPHHAQSQTPF